MKWNLDTGIATTNISCSNICITPFTSVSSFLPHISHPTPLVHTCICALLFLQGHILPGWLTASNCLLTSITVFLLLLAKRVMLQYLSNKHGFKVVSDRQKCDFSFSISGIELATFQWQDITCFFNTCSVSTSRKRCGTTRKKRCRGAWKRSLSMCSTWYFLHFKTLELYCCQHDG